MTAPDIITFGGSFQSRGIVRGAQQADRALGGLQTRADKMDKAFRRLRNLTTGGLGFIALTRAIRAGVSAVAAYEKSSAKMNSVLRATGFAAGLTRSQLEALNRSLTTATLFDDESIRNAQSLLLTFREIGADVFPRATRTVLDMSAALDQGLKESAIQLGKALNDPIRGVTALQRVGITFNETQRAQIKSFQETNQLAKAQAVILSELEHQFGGTAAGQNVGLSGAIAQTSKAFTDWIEGLGRGAAQIGLFERAVTALGDALARATTPPDLSGQLLQAGRRLSEMQGFTPFPSGRGGDLVAREFDRLARLRSAELREEQAALEKAKAVRELADEEDRLARIREQAVTVARALADIRQGGPAMLAERNRRLLRNPDFMRQIGLPGVSAPQTAGSTGPVSGRSMLTPDQQTLRNLMESLDEIMAPVNVQLDRMADTMRNLKRSSQELEFALVSVLTTFASSLFGGRGLLASIGSAIGVASGLAGAVLGMANPALGALVAGGGGIVAGLLGRAGSDSGPVPVHVASFSDAALQQQQQPRRVEVYVVQGENAEPRSLRELSYLLGRAQKFSPQELVPPGSLAGA